jgi:hypothetical protein
LNTYLPKPKLKGRKNLISGEMEDDPEMLALVRLLLCGVTTSAASLNADAYTVCVCVCSVASSLLGYVARKQQKAKESVELVSFWKPNLTLNMVHDFTVYPRGGIPPQMEERALSQVPLTHSPSPALSPPTHVCRVRWCVCGCWVRS